MNPCCLQGRAQGVHRSGLPGSGQATAGGQAPALVDTYWPPAWRPLACATLTGGLAVALAAGLDAGGLVLVGPESGIGMPWSLTFNFEGGAAWPVMLARAAGGPGIRALLGIGALLGASLVIWAASRSTLAVLTNMSVPSTPNPSSSPQAGPSSLVSPASPGAADPGSRGADVPLVAPRDVPTVDLPSGLTSHRISLGSTDDTHDSASTASLIEPSYVWVANAHDHETVMRHLYQDRDGDWVSELTAIATGIFKAVKGSKIGELQQETGANWINDSDKMRLKVAAIGAFFMETHVANRRHPFKEGSFICPDPKGKLAAYLRPHDLDEPNKRKAYRKKGIYSRISSHLVDMGGKTWGVDIKNSKAEARRFLPARHRHVLFRSFKKDGKNYLMFKSEPAGLASISEAILHGFHYLEAKARYYADKRPAPQQGLVEQRERLPEHWRLAFRQLVQAHATELRSAGPPAMTKVGCGGRGKGISKMVWYLDAWSKNPYSDELIEKAKKLRADIAEKYGEQGLDHRFGEEAQVTYLGRLKRCRRLATGGQRALT